MYFMSFNNGNFSWNRLIGYPVVRRCCSSQELLHPEKDITCYLDISYLPSSALLCDFSTTVFFIIKKKKYTHTLVKGPTYSCNSYNNSYILFFLCIANIMDLNLQRMKNKVMLILQYRLIQEQNFNEVLD